MTDWKPGDIGLAHTAGMLGRAIRFAENRDQEPSEFNHVFMLDHLDDQQEWVVVQAEMCGVTNTRRLSEVAPGGTIEIIPFPEQLANRDKFVAFMRAQVGDDYSLMAIFSNVLDMYLPDSICLRRADTWICSGLVCAALLFAGFEPLIDVPDIYTITPGAIQVVLNA